MRTCFVCGRALPDHYGAGICAACLLVQGDTLEPEAGRAQMLLPGELPVCLDFAERYVFEDMKPFAEGGQGEVYRVRDRRLRRDVALKRLRDEFCGSQVDESRFVAEAQIASQLNHPGVLPVFEFGLDPVGRPFYITSLQPERGFEELILGAQGTGRGTGPPLAALSALIRVCETVGFIHSRGVCHRDLKPSNILVGDHGEVFLVDFGSAAVLSVLNGGPEVRAGGPAVETDRQDALAGGAADPLATRRAGRPSTLIYTAPECVCDPARGASAAEDIYALGVILYQACCGRLPYASSKGCLPAPRDLERAIRAGPPLSVRALDRSVPRDLETICLKAMAREPAHRYPAAEEMAEDIRAYMEVRPVMARRPGPLLVWQRWAQRNAAVVFLMALILVLGSSAYAIVQGLRSERDVARQLTALREADLAARAGQWRQALRHWDEAESAGFRDRIHLALRRSEAWAVLSDVERAHTELSRLLRRSDLGRAKGAILLRLGEHELFHKSSRETGIQHIQEAIAAGLTPADKLFAEGLLADSTPAALSKFEQALQLDPYHHGAHRHALGLENLLGQRAALRSHLQIFRVLFPDDHSVDVAEAVQLALAGKVSAAEDRIRGLRAILGETEWEKFRLGLRFFALGPEHFNLEVVLGERKINAEGIDKLQTELFAVLGVTDVAGAVNTFVPELPCLQQGVRDAFHALQIIKLPMLGDIGVAVQKIKSAWTHHPEASLPFYAASVLDQRLPVSAKKSLPLVAVEAELLQMAVESPSIVPTLPRLTRYLSTIAHHELVTRDHTTKDRAREVCRTNIVSALASEELSASECRIYYDIAVQLRFYELAAQLLGHWARLKGEDPAVTRARIELDLATEHWPDALKRLNEQLTFKPEDDWLRAQKQWVVQQLVSLLATNSASNHKPRSP